MISKQALETSTQQHLEALKKQGFSIAMIPSKVIYTIKAPDGRRKCRLVACGNFLGSNEDSKQAHKQAVYTASIGIETLRMGLTYSARRSHTLVTLDIKAAFLNAQLLPRDRSAAERVAEANIGARMEPNSFEGPNTSEAGEASYSRKEVVALIPPRKLVTKGVFTPQNRLMVRKAVYGLDQDQAPRDWAFLRDSTLPTLKVVCGPKAYKLFRSYSDDNIWLLAQSEPRLGFAASESDCQGDGVEGWLAIYVDDVLVAAERELAWAAVRTIQACWQCSSPEELKHDGQQQIRFLGMDLRWDLDGNLTLDQEAYIREGVRKSVRD